MVERIGSSRAVSAKAAASSHHHCGLRARTPTSGSSSTSVPTTRARVSTAHTALATLSGSHASGLSSTAEIGG